MPRIVTLTSDFGVEDHYVSVMKAVVLEKAPLNTRLVDISHAIPPNDIMAGAWVVREAARYFPEDTIHVVVVDPGVGTDRDPVLIRSHNQWFIGPDNGLFSLISQDAGYEAWRLNNPRYWLEELSSTFHGRDLFAPVAAHLASGVAPNKLGSPDHTLMTWRWPEPILDKDGVRGWIAHIDHFGNLITNIPSVVSKEFPSDPNTRIKIYVGNTILEKIDSTFGDVESGEAVMFPGSSNMLEIAVNKGNASELLGVPKGSEVTIVFQKSSIDS